MVPSHHRLRRSTQFESAVRHGVRAGRRHVVVHMTQDLTSTNARVGFVVSKAVGNSVVRHRVTRKLRHVMAMRLDRLPHTALVVLRANPSAATADFAELSADVDAALNKVIA